MADIKMAHEALRGQVVRTPLLTFPALDALVGGRVYIKPENLQHTGSFKYRGALNHISHLKGDKAPPAVIAYSSGNHAQGVAKAAQDAGIPCSIVMPKDAPKTKIARTRAFGADVVLYDRETESREAVAAALPAANAAYLIPPYDHPLTIAGQGTIGVEVCAQMRQEALNQKSLDQKSLDRGSLDQGSLDQGSLDQPALDQALICCGGGGLAAGVTVALRETYPTLKSYACEPKGFDDFRRSLAQGQRVENADRSGSICDAIITPTPGVLTFDLAQSLSMEGVAVSDEEALDAVAYAAQRLRLIVEPGGAVALAAALFGKIDMAGKSTLVVLSGGNIDGDLLIRALDRDLRHL